VAVTSGEVPHVQLNPESTPEVIAELFDRVFARANLEDRPSILGMQGTRALWLTEAVAITRPECVVGVREFAHIHVDGSLHAVLPFGLIPQAVAAGWAERHPFALTTRGFEAFVMLFAPRSSEEVDVILQFILDSVDFITGG
jgi:phospholipase/carboxylesterase